MNLTEQSKEDITDDVIESRDVEDKNFKQQYLQKTITFLTEENLDKLKKHCNKAIHYERGIEHKVVLELLQKYKEYLAEREQDKARIKKLEREKNYLSQDNEILARGNFKKFKFLNYSYVETPKIEMEEYKSNDYINKNYIPVQKVKDKMKKLNEEIKNSDEIEAIFKIKQQQILQELLEDK